MANHIVFIYDHNMHIPTLLKNLDLRRIPRGNRIIPFESDAKKFIEQHKIGNIILNDFELEFDIQAQHPYYNDPNYTNPNTVPRPPPPPPPATPPPPPPGIGQAQCLIGIDTIDYKPLARGTNIPQGYPPPFRRANIFPSKGSFVRGILLMIPDRTFKFWLGDLEKRDYHEYDLVRLPVSNFTNIDSMNPKIGNIFKAVSDVQLFIGKAAYHQQKAGHVTIRYHDLMEQGLQQNLATNTADGRNYLDIVNQRIIDTNMNLAEANLDHPSPPVIEDINLVPINESDDRWLYQWVLFRNENEYQRAIEGYSPEELVRKGYARRVIFTAGARAHHRAPPNMVRLGERFRNIARDLEPELAAGMILALGAANIGKLKDYAKARRKEGRLAEPAAGWKKHLPGFMTGGSGIPGTADKWKDYTRSTEVLWTIDGPWKWTRWSGAAEHGTIHGRLIDANVAASAPAIPAGATGQDILTNAKPNLGVAGKTIVLLDNAGAPIAGVTATTDGQGRFTLQNIPLGSGYTVAYQQPPNVYKHTDAGYGRGGHPSDPANPPPPAAINLTAADAVEENVIIPYVERGVIKGRLINHRNAVSGGYSPTTHTGQDICSTAAACQIAGATVYLLQNPGADLDAAAAAAPHVTTRHDGKFEFTGVPDGSGYVVAHKFKNAWFVHCPGFAWPDFGRGGDLADPTNRPNESHPIILGAHGRFSENNVVVSVTDGTIKGRVINYAVAQLIPALAPATVTGQVLNDVASYPNIGVGGATVEIVSASHGIIRQIAPINANGTFICETLPFLADYRIKYNTNFHFNPSIATHYYGRGGNPAAGNPPPSAIINLDAAANPIEENTAVSDTGASPPPVTMNVVITQPPHDAPDPAAVKRQDETMPVRGKLNVTGIPPAPNANLLFALYDMSGNKLNDYPTSSGVVNGFEAGPNITFNTTAPGDYFIGLWAQCPPGTSVAPLSLTLTPGFIGPDRRKIQITSAAPPPPPPGKGSITGRIIDENKADPLGLQRAAANALMTDIRDIGVGANKNVSIRTAADQDVFDNSRTLVSSQRTDADGRFEFNNLDLPLKDAAGNLLDGSAADKKIIIRVAEGRGYKYHPILPYGRSGLASEDPAGAMPATPQPFVLDTAHPRRENVIAGVKIATPAPGDVDWWLTVLGKSVIPPGRILAMSFSSNKKVVFYVNRNISTTTPNCQAKFEVKWELEGTSMNTNELKELMSRTIIKSKLMSGRLDDKTSISTTGMSNAPFISEVPITPNVPKSARPGSKYLRIEVSLHNPRTGFPPWVRVRDLYTKNAKFKLILTAEAQPVGTANWSGGKKDKTTDIIIQLTL